MFKYTREHIDFLQAIVKGRSYVEVHQMFNKHFDAVISLSALRSACKRYDLRNELDGRFPLRHIPYNKGMTGLNTGGEAGWFKKGHRPKSWRSVGSERISVDGYIEIKVEEPRKWRLKHCILWEQATGQKIPKGCSIIFADGNKTNLDLDNLVLVSRAELLYLNRHNMIYNDSELTKAAVNVARVANAIYSREQTDIVAQIKTFLKSNNISCLVNGSKKGLIYIYFMDKYAIRIASGKPGYVHSKRITYDLDSTAGSLEPCFTWIKALLKKDTVNNG